MTNNNALAVLGLFLVLVLARLAERAYSRDRDLGAQVSGFLARRGIDFLAVIGWAVDHLPLPGT